MVRDREEDVAEAVEDDDETAAEDYRAALKAAEVSLAEVRKDLQHNNRATRTQVVVMVNLAFQQHPELLAHAAVQQFMGTGGLQGTDQRSLADYESIQPLASGRNELLRAKFEGTTVCLKKFSLRDEKMQRAFLKEIRSVQVLNNPFIISYGAVFEHQKHMYVQMDYHRHGSLRNWIRECNPDLQIRRSVLRQVLLGIACIHRNKMAHCDLKGENILITEELTPLICDFEMTKSLDAAAVSASSSLRGTLGFLAPELVSGAAGGSVKPSEATDMYAFGVTMLNTVHPPDDSKYPIIDASVVGDPALKQVIMSLLSQSSRPSAVQLQTSGYFAAEAVDEWGRVNFGSRMSTRSCRDDLLAAGADALGVPRVIDVVGEVDERMQVHSLAGLDQAERDRRFALFVYTMNSRYCAQGQQPFDVFNRTLRARGGVRFDAWTPFLEHLMRAMGTLPDTAAVVYRGLDAPNLREYTMSKKIHWSGFSSASIHASVARDQFAGGGVVFIITAHNTKDIQRFSWFGDMEGELLLSPNMEFLVTKEVHTPTTGPLQGCTVIELQQIPDSTLWT
eukprot:COSAG06_NODE_243_length_19221_cov_15.057578_4_plen_563_part_00